MEASFAAVSRKFQQISRQQQQPPFAQEQDVTIKNSHFLNSHILFLFGTAILIIPAPSQTFHCLLLHFLDRQADLS
jgi:hypothetical protein